jgi:hypothetical protein
MRGWGGEQAFNRWGASWCSAFATILDALTSNLQNIGDKHAVQPTKKRATPYRIDMLPLLNRPAWKQLIFKNVCTCKMLCEMVQSLLCM